MLPRVRAYPPMLPRVPAYPPPLLSPPILLSSYPPILLLCFYATASPPRLLALVNAYVRPKLASHRSDFSASNAGMLSALSSVVLARPPATDPHAPRAIPPPLRRPPPRTIADLEEKRFWREISSRTFETTCPQREFRDQINVDDRIRSSYVCFNVVLHKRV